MALLDFFNANKKDPSAPEIAPVLPNDIYAQGTLDLADTIAPAGLKIGSKEIEIGEKFSRSFYTISYPRFLADSWFEPIINLDKVFDVGIFIHPINTGQALRDFQKKVAEVQSQISDREEKGLVRDPLLDTAYQDIENLRDQLQQAQEHLFEVGLYITLYASSMEELDKIEGDVRGILDSKLIYTKPALFQQEQGFRSTLPLANDELSVNTKLTSSPLSSIFPFVSFDLTSDRGILYGINRHNSSLILFDRFSLENYNSVTFAKSGSGKSIRGNESVLIRENGKVHLAKIGPIVEKLIRARGLEQIDEELEGVTEPGIEVFSFDKNQQGRWSSVSVAARKVAPDEYYTFTTASGRSITTTADHNMLVLRDGTVVAAKSDAVQEGESVPLPRSVSAFSDTPSSLNLLKLFAKRKNIYVVGASELITKYRKEISKKTIDTSHDRYLYKYATGRRMPIDYFLSIVKRLGLEVNDSLAATLTISSGNGAGTLSALLPASPALGRLLGYISSEGTVTDGSILISNIDPEIISDIENAFDTLGVSHYKIDRAVATSHRPFLVLVDALGAGGNSQTKQVPADLFGMHRQTAASYLQAYFEGDGGIDGVSVTALSKSRELISGLSYLLLSFGIITRVHKRAKRYVKTGGRRVFWQLTISGQSNLHAFSKQIGFVSERKQRGLVEILGKNENTNVDVIPGLKGLADELTELFGSQLYEIPDLSCLRQGKSLSPQRLGRLVSDIELRINHFENLVPFMQTLSELPSIEAIVAKAKENRELTRNITESLGSSWYTVAQGMPPRISNALKIFAAAGELGQRAPATSGELKTMILEGVQEMNVQQNAIAPNLSLSLRGVRDDSSYAMMQHAAEFITNEYERVCSKLPRVIEIIKIFKRLAESDLFWDPIVSITKSPNTREKYVYDLTVDDEVFLAGDNGMFVHNSYAVKLEILRSLMFDTDVIVIDPEREYEYLAQATGGRLFNISLSSENHINPFDLPPVKEDEEPADILRSNIINLVGLFRIMLGGLTPEEDAIVDRAISETYALKDITGDADFTGSEPPLLGDFESVLSGMEGSESILQRLSKFTHGTWAGFLNQPTNVDINKQFIVFSVRDMEDELKPVAMYIVTHFIWNAVRHELKKRLLIIDEAWWMMKSEDTASFLYSLAKRGRKYYLGLSTITQDVEDFLRSPYGKPILTNSSIQLLLKQSPTTIDVLKETFNLTDEEKYLLLESGVGEGLFFAGLKHVAIKIVASYTEDQIITSDPSQLLAIKQEKQRNEASDTTQS